MPQMGERQITMKKINILGIALLALFAFGAMATGASAETVWLVSGALTAVKEPVVIEEGVLKVDVLNSLLGLIVEFECSGEFDGTVGPDAQDEITKILDLNLKDIGALGALGTGLDCSVIGSPLICTNAAKLVELWPDNLPWPSLVVLVGEETDDKDGEANKEPGFDLECENSNGTFTEALCEGALLADLLNLTNDVQAVFLEQDQSCTEAGETAHITGEGLIVVASGLTLAVSEG